MIDAPRQTARFVAAAIVDRWRRAGFDRWAFNSAGCPVPAGAGARVIPAVMPWWSVNPLQVALAEALLTRRYVVDPSGLPLPEEEVRRAS